MKLAFVLVLFLAAPAAAHLPAPGVPGAPNDPRYCGEPKRDKQGHAIRSQKVLREFVKVFPCPATLKPTISCKGWALDHTLPIANGGCDSVANITWLPVLLKSCAGRVCKDRWERLYHAFPRKRITLEAL